MKVAGGVRSYRWRRASLILVAVAAVAALTFANHFQYAQDGATNSRDTSEQIEQVRQSDELHLAKDVLDELDVRERAAREGYSQEVFSPEGWTTVAGCDMRNRILQRDLAEVEVDDDGCTVDSGVLEEGPFTGEEIEFERGPETSGDIHIEHIVAVSDAWQKGAQDLSQEQRHDFFNDPLNLIAIDGPINMEKGDADAGEWMPPHEDYHCRYVARQIAIKHEYKLWLSQGEYEQMHQTLTTCPAQPLPITNAVDAPY